MKRYFLLLFLAYSGGLSASNGLPETRPTSAAEACEGAARALSGQVASKQVIPELPVHPRYTGAQAHQALTVQKDKFAIWKDLELTGLPPVLKSYVQLSAEENAAFERELGKRTKKSASLDDSQLLNATVVAFLTAEEAVANDLWFKSKRIARENTSADPTLTAEAARLRERARAIYQDNLARYVEVLRGSPRYVERISQRDRAQLGANLAAVMEKLLEATGIPTRKIHTLMPMTLGKHVVWEVDSTADCGLCSQARDLQKKLGRPDFQVHLSPSMLFRAEKDGFIDLAPPRYLLSPLETLKLELGPDSAADVKDVFQTEKVVAKLATPMDFAVEKREQTASGASYDRNSGSDLMARVISLQRLGKRRSEREPERSKDLSLLVSLLQMHDSLEKWHVDTATLSYHLTYAMTLLPHLKPGNLQVTPGTLFHMGFDLGPGHGLQIMGINHRGEDIFVVTSQGAAYPFPANGGLRNHFDRLSTEVEQLKREGYSLAQDRRIRELTWDLMATLKLKAEVGNRFGAELSTKLPPLSEVAVLNPTEEKFAAIAHALEDMKLPSIKRVTLRTAPPESPNIVASIYTGLPAVTPHANAPRPFTGNLLQPVPFLHHVEAFKAAKEGAAKDAAADKIAMTVIQRYAEQTGWIWQDVSKDAVGYDVELFNPHTGENIKVEVKSKTGKSDTVSLYHSEVENFARQPERMLLAIVRIDAEGNAQFELRQPQRLAPPDPLEITRTYSLSGLLNATPPLEIPSLMGI